MSLESGGPGGGGCARGGGAIGGTGVGSGTRTPLAGGGPCGGATGGISSNGGGTGFCVRETLQPGYASISSAESMGCSPSLACQGLPTSLPRR